MGGFESSEEADLASIIALA